MFEPDVVHLRQFYGTPLGEAARRLIARGIEQFWPQASGDTLLAIGFPTPYLDAHLGSGAPVFVCMPAAQGAVFWPPSRGNLTFLAHEAELPLQDKSVNRVLLIHAVEHSEELSWMIREAWRVLTPGGRLLAVVPNRLSFWSRSPRSPFGYGRPFTTLQLRALLAQHEFTPLRTRPALFPPPLYWQWLWRFADKIEAAGCILCRPLGGVLLCEAEKQVYAAVKQPSKARAAYQPAVKARPAMSRR